MKNLRLSVILSILLLPLTAGAQKLMTLDEAIMQALEHNYSLKISRNDYAIAENNVTPTPFLPTLETSARQQQTKLQRTTSAGALLRTLQASKAAVLACSVIEGWQIKPGCIICCS
jgi:hypothetical protein